MVLMGEFFRKSTIKLPKWVIKKPVISDVQNMTIATMNRNKSQYEQCNYCNGSNVAWGYHWNIEHR